MANDRTPWWKRNGLASPSAVCSEGGTDEPHQVIIRPGRGDNAVHFNSGGEVCRGSGVAPGRRVPRASESGD